MDPTTSNNAIEASNNRFGEKINLIKPVIYVGLTNV